MSASVDDLKAAEKEKLLREFDDADIVAVKSKQSCYTGRHHTHNGHSQWGFGLILIAVGIALLASNTIGWQIMNWWALFILLPASGSIKKAFAIRDRTGHYPKEAREALGWGVILLLVAGLFLFGLSWNVFWPILVVGLGLRVIINNTLH